MIQCCVASSLIQKFYMWNSVASSMIQRSMTQADGKDVHLGGSRAGEEEGSVNLIH